MAVPVLSRAKHVPAMVTLGMGMQSAQRTLSGAVHLPKCAQTTGRMAACAAASAVSTCNDRSRDSSAERCHVSKNDSPESISVTVVTGISNPGIRRLTGPLA